MKHREYAWDATKLFPDAIKNTLVGFTSKCSTSFWKWCLCKLSTIHTRAVILLCQSIPSTPASFICSRTFYIYCWISTILHPFLLPAILFGEKDLRDQWSTQDAWRTDYYSHPKNQTNWCQKRKNSHEATDFIVTVRCTLACQLPDNTVNSFTPTISQTAHYYTQFYTKANITEWHKHQRHSVACD
jgi:hypothetical protein